MLELPQTHLLYFYKASAWLIYWLVSSRNVYYVDLLEIFKDS